MNKLLLGCGDWNWPDYVRIDASPKSAATIVTAIPPLPLVVQSNRWDEVLMVHTIEHLAPWLALELCQQVYHCLAPNGVFILEQPNILYAAQVLLGLILAPVEEFPGQYSMAAFYGDPSHKDEYMLHRWGYHPSSLRALLQEAGFGNNRIADCPAIYHRPIRDFRIEARK